MTRHEPDAPLFAAPLKHAARTASRLTRDVLAVKPAASSGAFNTTRETHDGKDDPNSSADRRPQGLLAVRVHEAVQGRNGQADAYQNALTSNQTMPGVRRDKAACGMEQVASRGRHPNSRAAWRSLDIEGRQREVLDVLDRRGRAMTDREVMVALGSADPNYVRPAICHLVSDGVLVEIDSVVCPHTHRRVRRVFFAGEGQ